MHVATHSGSFHADDVLAYALIRAFVDRDATIERTRDKSRLEAADIVVDVGGAFDPGSRRFDHHQKTYEGDRSSAGMVLDWLEAESKVSASIAQRLREVLVDHVDAVDNGRRTPEYGVPCFSTFIGSMTESDVLADGEEASFDALYVAAADAATVMVQGIAAGVRRAEEARQTVRAAMDAAIGKGHAVVELSEYCKWKPAYFELGGAEHPTDYVLFPGKGDYRVIAIPPELGSFDEKRPFPESWAGLENEALSEVTGVPGAVFCHKNRFIAVFETREAAWDTLSKWGLTHRPAACGGDA